MKFRLFAFMLIMSMVLAVSASAQQDPFDQGLPDTAFFIISEPVVGAVDQVIQADLYFFNDAQNMGSVSAGFGWDNPAVVMDSVTWSPEAVAAFNMTQLAWYRNNLDSTNANQLFQAIGLRIFGNGLVGSLQPKLIASYFFRVPTWSASDQLCITLETFNNFAFVDVGNIEYRPIWRGPHCVGNVIDGVLEVSPTTLGFTGVAGEGFPSSQVLSISEATGDNIDYLASSSASWLMVQNSGGTTPHDNSVLANTSGLAPGDYTATITIESPEATNVVEVPVTLHLEQGNQGPVLATIGDRMVDEGQLLEFTVSATDPDGTIPTLSAQFESFPPGAGGFTDNGDGTGTFTWMTSFDEAGTYNWTFTASDGDLTDAETITITVNNVNRAPELAAIGDQQVLEGVPLIFSVSASDPDGQLLSFATSPSPLPGTADFVDNNDGTGTFRWTPSNTASGIYPITFSVSDGLLSDTEVVIIEVIDADGFVLDPNPLLFSLTFNGGQLGYAVSLSVSDGSLVEFTASETADWLSVDPTSGTTPAMIMVEVDAAGLAAGTHVDSIMISGGGLDPIWERVEFTIENRLMVTPTELAWTFSEGDMMVDPLTFDVAEMGGDAISFEATESADWLMLTDAAGMTPATVTAALDLSALAPGEYNTTIMVSGDAVNAPLEVAVSVTVTACPTFTTAPVVYNRITFAGETVMFDEVVSLTSSGPAEILWDAMGGSAYTFDPMTGTTPGDLGVHYEQMFAAAGMFADTAYVNAVATDTYSCPSQVMIITNVTVNRPPSADTVIVVSTPAVPGMRVGVPIIFTNSCALTEVGLSLNWTSGMHLDSVSFVGSACEYVDGKMVNINNDLMDVTITATVGDQMDVPIGSGQLLATMFFALPCEIEAGAYPFSLGATPPLDPTDVYFVRNCGEGDEIDTPEYIPGSIIVGTASNYVCGYVVDPFDNEIVGASVELWEDYPFTMPLMSTMSTGIGSFAFDEIMVIPFDLYAYKEGYYPGKVEDINFGDKGIKIVLEPISESLTPTSEWVDYYCPEGSNIFLSAPAPVGSVVEAYTPAGLLVGQKTVMTSGQYGFMPVYRAMEASGDLGAMTGEMIHFTINGMDAIATGNTTYPSEYMQMDVCLEVRGTVTKDCTLFEGWNLISWNVNTESDAIMDVLAPIMDYVDVVLGFEQGGLTFDPDLVNFSTLSEVDHYSGYWVKIEGMSEVSFPVTGLPVPEMTPIPLTTGWNLVSYLRDESWATETALMNVDHVVQFAYGFPGGEIKVWEPEGSFNTLETFDPCNGYWIKSTADVWLTYSGMDSIPANRPVPGKGMALSNGGATSTNWVNLYSHNLTVDGAPVASGDIITAHTVADDTQAGSFTMTSSGQFGFMPVYGDASGEKVTGLNAGDEFYLMVNGMATDEVFSWTANGDRLEISALSTANSTGLALPQDYSLAQNYPNPFNPSTNISFLMPTTGNAKVEIFNVLGRSIAVIFDGLAQAGENILVWDGRNSDGEATASGVYFYRLTADNYEETRKMMLLK